MDKKLLKHLENFDIFIFDFDGTLLNSEPCHLRAHNAVLSFLLGREVNMSKEEFVTKYGGKSDNEIYELYKKDFDIEYNKQEMINKKIALSNTFLAEKGVKIFDYFFEIVNTVKDKKFYILSNQVAYVIENILSQKKIKQYFTKVFSLPEVGIKKLDFLKNISQYIDITDKKVVLFEDNFDALKYALECGFEAVGIETEHNEGRLNSLPHIINCK